MDGKLNQKWFQKLRSGSRVPLFSGISHLFFIKIMEFNKRRPIEKAQCAIHSLADEHLSEQRSHWALDGVLKPLIKH
jgi:hypothetical protein